jgi:hypothetical protein
LRCPPGEGRGRPAAQDLRTRARARRDVRSCSRTSGSLPLRSSRPTMCAIELGRRGRTQSLHAPAWGGRREKRRRGYSRVCRRCRGCASSVARSGPAG